ncbi:hypothetical protein H5410_059415 [Solanum commersonii]|uniref:Uncharacterized protein n=1 Tax=Solanum commersonii TaxID=4109 RepID=A0A9J5W2K4_SOLCO|nr:hypothetical protein H5410_059415 [Solanum commersonii]
MSCSACKSKGHNIRTCPNKPPPLQRVLLHHKHPPSSKRSGKRKSHPTQAKATISIFEPSQAIVQSDKVIIEKGNQDWSTRETDKFTIVTGDLGYAPSKGLKWKGKSAITGRQLQHKSALLRQ